MLLLLLACLLVPGRSGPRAPPNFLENIAAGCGILFRDAQKIMVVMIDKIDQSPLKSWPEGSPGNDGAFLAISFGNPVCAQLLWPDRPQVPMHIGKAGREELRALWSSYNFTDSGPVFRGERRYSCFFQRLGAVCEPYEPPAMKDVYAYGNASIEYFRGPYQEDITFLKTAASLPESLVAALFRQAPSTAQAELVWWNVYYPQLVALPGFTATLRAAQLEQSAADKEIYYDMLSFYGARARLASKDPNQHAFIFLNGFILPAAVGGAMLLLILGLYMHLKAAEFGPNTICGRYYLCCLIARMKLPKSNCCAAPSKSVPDEDVADDDSWSDDENDVPDDEKIYDNVYIDGCPSAPASETNASIYDNEEFACEE